MVFTLQLVLQFFLDLLSVPGGGLSDVARERWGQWRRLTSTFVILAALPLLIQNMDVDPRQPAG
jgi:hypothetical protein